MDVASVVDDRFVEADFSKCVFLVVNKGKFCLHLILTKSDLNT